MADLIDQPLPGIGADAPALPEPSTEAVPVLDDVVLPSATIVPFPLHRAVVSTPPADSRNSASGLLADEAQGVPDRVDELLTQAAMDAHPAAGGPRQSGPRRPSPRATPSAPRRREPAPASDAATGPAHDAAIERSDDDGTATPWATAPATPASTPAAARSHGRVERHRVQRPGAVGGVVVRAPMLDPTRHAVAPTPARRLLGSKAPDTQLHPRVAKRLNDVRRSRRKTVFRPAFAVITVAAVVVVGVLVALFSPMFTVSRVAVDFRGSARQTADLDAIVRTVRGKNIVRLDLGATDRSIKALPWVARSSVRRSLPHTVQISVVAHDVAGAVALSNGQFAVTASDATVLTVVGPDDPALVGLPTVDLGLTAVPVAGDSLAGPAPDVLASAASVEHRFPGQLRTVRLVEGEVEWMIRPRPGTKAIRVRVGAPTSSDVPAAALASVLARSGPAPIGIDLRTPDTPVVQTAAKA